MNKPRKKWLWLGAGIAGTLLVTFLVLNIMPRDQQIEKPIERLYDTASPQFERVLGSLLGPPVVDGNTVVELVNGQAIFPPMLAAIAGARRTITFESYIYWSGDVGDRFANALSERARAGVRVHVLLDWVGSARIEEALLERMRAAGVEIEMFHPLSWYDIARLNNRTHRKILVTDGRIGFTGGVGIADKWDGNAQDADHWRDTHFRIEGPAVAQMQATFLDNWTKVTGRVLHGEDYFPRLESRGSMRAQMFSSSPEGGAESMRLMYLLAIAAAATSIDLANAYFVPDEFAVQALVAAMSRGVRLRIIVPGPITDTQTVRHASRNNWGPLLAAGAQIYEYQPTMYHCKVMVVDARMVSVGSTNFDPRSFRLNDEANLNVFDAAFARRQIEVFEADLAQSRRVSLEEWAARPWWQRAWETVASVIEVQL